VKNKQKQVIGPVPNGTLSTRGPPTSSKLCALFSLLFFSCISRCAGLCTVD